MTHYTDVELLPCPFCGGKAEAKKPDTSYEFTLIKCQECDVKTGECIDFADAAEAWNCRTQPSEAVPVQFPEPFAYVEHHKAGDNLWFDHPGGKHSALYTEQQVIDLLKSVGVSAKQE